MLVEKEQRVADEGGDVEQKQCFFWRLGSPWQKAKCLMSERDKEQESESAAAPETETLAQTQAQTRHTRKSNSPPGLQRKPAQVTCCRSSPGFAASMGEQSKQTVTRRGEGGRREGGQGRPQVTAAAGR